MKALACFLLAGLLVVGSATFGRSDENAKCLYKTISSGLNGDMFLVSSDFTDGELKEVRIYNFPGLSLVASSECEDYTCGVDISSLPSGYYVVEVDHGSTMTPLEFTK